MTLKAPRTSGDGGGGGDVFGAKTPPPATPSRNVGAFRFQHRRGIAIPGPFGAANRAASSKQARFIRHWRRFACFPHTPLKRHKEEGLRPLPFADAQRKWRRQTPRKHAGPGFPIRNRPGSAERSGERGKRSRGLTMTTHESRTYAIKCGAAVLCSTGVRRTRQVTAPLGGTVSPAPRPRST